MKYIILSFMLSLLMSCDNTIRYPSVRDNITGQTVYCKPGDPIFKSACEYYEYIKNRNQ